MQYFNQIQPSIDKYGLIAMQGGDEGDSCAREADFAILIKELCNQNKISLADYLTLRKRYFDNFNKLKQGRGALNRGLAPNNWVSQPGGVVMSRDQWTPSVIACGAMDLRLPLNYLLLGHLLRGLLFTTNTCPNWVIVGQSGYKWKIPDITVLNSWGLYIRAYDFFPFYPLLFLFDLQTLAQAFLIIYNSYKDPTNTSDISNFLNILIQAYDKMPTPFTWLSRKLLKFCKSGVGAVLDNYFSGGSPPLAPLYKEVLDGMK